jgi:hypothetical protein
VAEIPTEALEAAARVGDQHAITVGGGGPRWNGAYCRWCGWESGVGEMTQQQAADEGWRHVLTEALTAAAPYLISEARRQGELHALQAAEEAILAEPRPNPVFDTGGVVLAAAVVRRIAERAGSAKIAEGSDGD